MSSFHRTGGLGLAAVAFSGVVTAGVLGSVLLQRPAQEAITRAAVTGEPAGGLAVVWVLSALLMLVAGPVAGLLTGLWLTTARANAVQIQPRHVRRHAVWAWLGWIFPLVLLGFPRQIVDDVLWVTEPSTASRGTRTSFWWRSYLLLLLASVVGFVVRFTGGPPDLTLALDVVTGVLAVVSLVLWAGVVRRVDTASRTLVRWGHVPRPAEVLPPDDRFAPAAPFSGVAPLSGLDLRDLGAPEPVDLFAPAPAPPGALPPQRG